MMPQRFEAVIDLVDIADDNIFIIR